MQKTFVLTLTFIHSGFSHNIGQAIFLLVDYLPKLYELENSNAKIVDSLWFPPFIIVRQVVLAAINSSQLKPNNHDFLKLLSPQK